jgi:hypothetical protein
VAYFHNTNKTKAKDLAGNAPAATPAPAVKPQQPAPTGKAAEPVKPADPAPAPNRTTGQIALPGSARAMVTQTPGAAEAAGTAAKPPAVAPVTPPSDVKPPVAVDKSAAGTIKPVEKAPEKVVSAAGSPQSGGALAEGKALIDAGSLVAGRRVINEALVGGRLNDADAQRAKEMIAAANETLVFSPRRFTDDALQGSYTMAGGDRLMKLASSCDVTWDFLKRINGISDERRIRAGQTLKTVKGPFHAVVSKSRFTMDLYFGAPGERGAMYVRSFPVGLGKHGSTPTGTWMVAPQSKLKNPKWWGTPDEPAREAGDPQNPLGKFWIGLHGTDGDALGKEGFGIHGTIDPDSIGKEMSHGCIRLVNENVERVYEMLVDGKSTIIVKD